LKPTGVHFASNHLAHSSESARKDEPGCGSHPNNARSEHLFDQDGNLWSGQNWMPGSQSGVNRNIGGGVLKMAPNRTPLSPPITGFTGMGLDGVGWGTLVTSDRVWISGFNGKMLLWI
jgi:hypothetical protein